MRKHRKCPHCKSEKGFIYITTLGGYEIRRMSFKGEIIDIDRQGIDKVEKTATCLNCKGLIDTDRLEVE